MTELSTPHGVILLSYRTPVAAYYDNGQGGKSLYRTKTHWSPMTSRHINKWIMTGFHDLNDATEMPQAFFDNLPLS
jgi:hypothetical protein